MYSLCRNCLLFLNFLSLKLMFGNKDTTVNICGMLQPRNLNDITVKNKDIRYNSKIRYNVNSVCTKISGSCNFFFIDIPMLFFRKTYVCFFVRIALARRF